jgi:hypothetical protein
VKKPRSVKHRQTGRPVSPQRVTSFHEAGHSVVAEALGFRIGKASLEYDGDEGFTVHAGKQLDWLTNWVGVHVAAVDVPRSLVTLRPPRLSERQREQVRGYITICCAGNVAESIVLGGRASQHWDAKHCDDRLNAEGAARMLGLSPKRAIKAHRETARRILIERWDAVKAVASALRRTERCVAWTWREVKGPELRRIIRAVDASMRKART